MKFFYALLVLIFIASCGENQIITSPEATPTQQTSQDINVAMGDLGDTIEDTVETLAEKSQKITITKSVTINDIVKNEEKVIVEPKVVELSTTYISPKTEVIMNINYTLSEDNTISEISVTSPNYAQIYKFNDGIQAVIGMTLEDASEYNVAGSSLGTVAFQKVLKNM